VEDWTLSKGGLIGLVAAADGDPRRIRRVQKSSMMASVSTRVSASSARVNAGRSAGMGYSLFPFLAPDLLGDGFAKRIPTKPMFSASPSSHYRLLVLETSSSRPIGIPQPDYRSLSELLIARRLSVGVPTRRRPPVVVRAGHTLLCG
jgi:hypothetical protein